MPVFPCKPKLPWYRKAPARLDDGSQPHRYSTPRNYFCQCQQYHEVCDILIRELVDRFEQEELMKTVLMLESLLLKAANGDVCSEEQLDLEQSFYKDDLDVDRLRRQLLLLVDVIKQGTPLVKKITTVRTICDAKNVQTAYKAILSEVHEVATALSENFPNICHG